MLYINIFLNTVIPVLNGIKKERLRNLSIANDIIDSISFASETLMITPEISMIFNLNYLRFLDLHPKLKYAKEAIKDAIDISKGVSKTLTTSNRRNSSIIANGSSDNLNNKNDESEEKIKSKNTSNQIDDVLEDAANNSTAVKKSINSLNDEVDDVSKSVNNQNQKNTAKLSKGNIDTIATDALSHSSIGDFTYNPKTGNVSKLKGGGHSQDNIDFLDMNGIEYNIEYTYPNGVRVGNIPGHKVKLKRTGKNQSWFPKSWNNKDIKNAGEYVANLIGNKDVTDGIIVYGEYKGVRVGVIRTDGRISTIFPDATTQP